MTAKVPGTSELKVPSAPSDPPLATQLGRKLTLSPAALMP